MVDAQPRDDGGEVGARGADVGASDWFLMTVFGAMMEVDFFRAGGFVSVVERVMSGPCSIGNALEGCDGIAAAVPCAGVCADGAAVT